MRSTRFTYFVVLISLVICLVSPLFSQQTEVRVDGQIIKNRIKRMADDKYLGRKPLTPEFGVLLDWAKNEFKKWGLDPAGDKGTPADVKAPRSFFVPTATEKDSVEKWEVESKDSTKILVAYKKGAAAIVMIRGGFFFVCFYPVQFRIKAQN